MGSASIRRRGRTSDPNDWFHMTCHFVDDRVMPGTLMYECCLHALRIYLMRMGWVANQEPGGQRFRAGAGKSPGPASSAGGEVIEIDGRWSRMKSRSRS